MDNCQLALQKIERISKQLPDNFDLKSIDEIKLDAKLILENKCIWNQELVLYNQLRETIIGHLEDLRVNLLGKEID